MEKIIVYFDDADYARQQLAPMEARDPVAAPTHWVLVACAPRLTKHVSKWVSHAAREAWRKKWAEKQFALVAPQLEAGGDRTTCVVAKGPLPALSTRLMAEHGARRVLDARRPKFGQDVQPVTERQPEVRDNRWQVPGAVAGLGTLLLLAE